MAQRIEKFTTVAAAGATDSFVDHTFLEGTVTRVELYVPDGHAGLTEWSFWFGTARLIPKTDAGVIVANDRAFEWDLEDAPAGTGYRSRVTNTDDFAHRFHVQVWLNELGAPDDELPTPILIIPIAGVL